MRAPRPASRRYLLTRVWAPSGPPNARNGAESIQSGEINRIHLKNDSPAGRRCSDIGAAIEIGEKNEKEAAGVKKDVLRCSRATLKAESVGVHLEGRRCIWR